MIRDLLLAHDFSSSSTRARAYAADLVRRTEATPHLMYVREVPLGPLVRGHPSPVREPHLQALQGAFETELSPSASAPDPVDCHVVQSSSTAPALVQFAEERGADLLVMGTHGRRGLQHAIHGSVAEEVVRTASCPVLTVRELDEGAPTVGVERIVVPVPLSESLRGVLQYAGQLADLYDVPIKLVHVVEVSAGLPLYEIEAPLVASRAGKTRAERQLAAWGEALRDDGHTVSYVVHRGAPVSTILDAAPSAGDMLVMATRGLSGWKQTVLGSVTRDVIRNARGPVVTARTFPEEETESASKER